MYTGDAVEPELLEVAFARSWAAHALIKEVDVATARSIPGVVGVWSAMDAPFPPTPPTPPNVPPEGVEWPTLARDKVRYFGEPLAIVAATDRYVAEDAVGLIDLDLEPLPSSHDPTEAAASDAGQLFDNGSNVMLEGRFGEDIEDAFERADVVLEGRFRHPRLAHMALEGRSFLAIPRADGLEVFCSHQAPHRLRMSLALALQMPQEKLRVRVPHVGGAFGGKSQVYPEYVAIAFLSLQLGRPLRWVEDRTESFVASAHGRGQNQVIRLAAERSGRIVALDVHIDGDVGAYPHTGALVPPITALMMPGPYRIPRLSVRFRSVLTNAVPTAPYRGAGRPEATLALEVMIDRLASEIGADPAEVRALNFIAPSEFPYETGTGEVYDSGDYPTALKLALDVSGYRESTVEPHGHEMSGFGIASFVERAGGQSNSSEFGSVEVTPEGRIVARSGAMSTGQGHATTFAQIVGSVFDVSLDRVDVIQGDTDEVLEGVGTFASRSVQLGGSALLVASQEVLDLACDRAATSLEVHRADLEYSEGRFSVVGASSRVVSIFELAAESDLQVGEVFAAKLTYPYGTYVASVIVDRDTGVTELRGITAADDCGTIVNPLLVEGQTVGSVAQGLGSVLLERVVYDDAGQPLAASMMDYLAPTLSEIPTIRPATMVTPSPNNPLGAKGAGEAGCIGTPAAVANAVLGILRRHGCTMVDVDLPFTPERVWRALRDGQDS